MNKIIVSLLLVSWLIPMTTNAQEDIQIVNKYTINSQTTYTQFLIHKEEIPVLTLEEFTALVETVHISNPSATKDELVSLVWKALVQKKQIDSIQLASKTFGVLTAQETWLLLTNPWYATATLYVTTEAQSRARAVWPNTAETLTRRDAFRHAYWNMLLAKFCSLDWAMKLATAHESESPAGNETTMDLMNNASGRNLFRIYGIRYNDDYALIVKNQRYIYVTTFNQSYAGLVFLQW